MRVAKRNAREQKDSPFSLSPRLSPDSRDLRRKAADERRCIAQPAGDWRVSAAASEETPAFSFGCAKRNVFLFHRSGGDFSLHGQRKVGAGIPRRWPNSPAGGPGRKIFVWRCLFSGIRVIFYAGNTGKTDGPEGAPVFLRFQKEVEALGR